jgi:hypothetical protein
MSQSSEVRAGAEQDLLESNLFVKKERGMPRVLKPLDNESNR